MSAYVKPDAAFKKLEAAKLLKQNVYIYGATGFGKTELIRQYFKKKIYLYSLQSEQLRSVCYPEKQRAADNCGDRTAYLR